MRWGCRGQQPPAQRPAAPRRPRQRQRIYDAAVLAALKPVWMIMDCICGKRQVAVLPEIVRVLERHGELAVAACIREKPLAALPCHGF